MPFQKGNTLGAKTKVIEGALRRAIAQDDGVRIRAMVEALLDKASEGDLAAANWIADRVDGKPHQSIEQVLDAKVEFEDAIGTAGKLLDKLRKSDA
jgi:hypothetical protein